MKTKKSQGITVLESKKIENESKNEIFGRKILKIQIFLTETGENGEKLGKSLKNAVFGSFFVDFWIKKAGFNDFEPFLCEIRQIFTIFGSKSVKIESKWSFLIWWPR